MYGKQEIRSLIYGIAVGDALGVPYEFRERDTYACDRMTGGGTHRQPAGTWSDDTGMTLATLHCLTESHGTVDEDELRAEYRAWLDEGRYAIDGLVFDCGWTIRKALRQGHGCGKITDNGNGSLMRIAPCMLFDMDDRQVGRVSAVTHAHPTSLDACAAYVRILRGLACGGDIRETLAANGYDGLWEEPRDAIRSGGYVLDTLRAACWCLAVTGDYRGCVLAAVNLGGDTDTTAGVAGALAGVRYGFDGIPGEWVDGLRGRSLLDGGIGLAAGRD